MAKYAPKTKIAKRRTYKRKSMSKSYRKPSKAFKKAVQSVISKNIEDKEGFLSTGTGLTYFNSYISANSDLMQVVPFTPNGSTEQHRIGDTIKAKSLVIKGYMILSQDSTNNNATNKRVAVRLMVVGSKRFKEWFQMQGNFAQSSQFLLKRGNTSVPFNGYINDLWTPLNTEEFTKYHDKVYYLSQDHVLQQIGSSTPTTVYAQDISKTIKFFTIKIPLRGKKLTFDSAIGNQESATNWTCGICLGYAHLDGSAPDAVDTKVGLCYDSYFTYEDA